MSFKVKIEYPLKQGLKPQLHLHLRRPQFHVKIEYPLKQGLKLDMDILGIIKENTLLK